MKSYTFELVSQVTVSANNLEEARRMLEQCMGQEEETNLNGCDVYFTPEQEGDLIDVFDWNEMVGLIEGVEHETTRTTPCNISPHGVSQVEGD